jgi:hypothetical protein
MQKDSERRRGWRREAWELATKVIGFLLSFHNGG